MMVRSLLPSAFALATLSLASAMPLYTSSDLFYPRAILSSAPSSANSTTSLNSTTAIPPPSNSTGNTTSTTTPVVATVGVTPTSPGPGMNFKSGGLCTTTWTPDTSGSEAWKSMEIALMTGSNLGMTKLAVVLPSIDGTSTSQTSYTFRCPDVSPYAAIYFLQFTPLGPSSVPPTSPAWTTRFAISDPKTGIYYPAPEANQPEGGSPAIPWGQGKLNLASGLTNSSSAGGVPSTPSATPLSPTVSSGTGSKGAAAQSAFSSAYAPGTAALLKAKSGNTSGAVRSQELRHAAAAALVLGCAFLLHFL